MIALLSYTTDRNAVSPWSQTKPLHAVCCWQEPLHFWNIYFLLLKFKKNVKENQNQAKTLMAEAYHTCMLLSTDYVLRGPWVVQEAWEQRENLYMCD